MTNPTQLIEQLVGALERIHLWADSQADAQSKGGHATFDLMHLREEREALIPALTAARAHLEQPTEDITEGRQALEKAQGEADPDDSLLLCVSDLEHSAIYDHHSEMQACVRAVAKRIKTLATNPQASEPAPSTAGERAEMYGMEPWEQDRSELIAALLEDAKHHEEIAGDCDCRPEDTVNWQHKLNCERAAALLQYTALPSQGERAEYPDKCPITRRPFFMVIEHPELGMVPTYGGPYDSYTIPHMLGEATQQMHERELEVHRYDHDEGAWVDDETIPLRVIHDDFLPSEDDATPAALPVGELTDEQITLLWIKHRAGKFVDQWTFAEVARAILAAARSQPVLEPLDEDQIDVVWVGHVLDGGDHIGFVRKIEAALGITQGGKV